MSRQLTVSQVTSHIGYVKGSLIFADSSILQFREYLNLKRSPATLAYSYHYSKEGDCVFRYDNAPHHRQVRTFPHHKHLGGEDTVQASAAPTLSDVLEEIARHVASLPPHV